MIARRNRIVRSDDYRSVVRSGRRLATPNAIVYLRKPAESRPVRVGFIVAKSVGNAVHRNLVRRRLKAIAAGLIPSLPHGTDLVIRALPGAAQASWATLNGEITQVLSKGMARS